MMDDVKVDPVQDENASCKVATDVTTASPNNAVSSLNPHEGNSPKPVGPTSTRPSPLSAPAVPVKVPTQPGTSNVLDPPDPSGQARRASTQKSPLHNLYKLWTQVIVIFKGRFAKPPAVESPTEPNVETGTSLCAFMDSIHPSDSNKPRKGSRPKVIKKSPRPVTPASSLPPKQYYLHTPYGLIPLRRYPDSSLRVNPHSSEFRRLPSAAESLFYKAGSSGTISSGRKRAKSVNELRQHRLHTQMKIQRSPDPSPHLNPFSGQFRRPPSASESLSSKAGSSYTISSGLKWNNVNELRRLHTPMNIDSTIYYMCNACTKVFGRLYNLIRHLRYHRAERFFQCDMRTKHFSAQSNLQMDQSLHTGEKPYECHISNKLFTENPCSKGHKFVYYGYSEPYAGNRCYAKFFRCVKAAFEMTHKKGVAYSCGNCDLKWGVYRQRRNRMVIDACRPLISGEEI